MTPLVFNLGVNDLLFDQLTLAIGAKQGRLEQRQFPDGESYLRFLTRCQDHQVWILAGLDRPNPKVLPLLLAAATLREQGAAQIGLIAPYLAYMRQDICFHEGESVSARHFAALLSRYFDALVTVDPHLHRFHSLDEIYTLASRVVSAAPRLADWIGSHVAKPLLIGPDSESKQWVAEVAARIDAPYLVLEKVRSGDRSVQISIPNVAQYRHCTPVLIDDMISTGHTLAAATKHLLHLNMPAPLCVAVHGVFAEGAAETLAEAGVSTIVTCNTVAHDSNAIDVSTLLAGAIVELSSS